MIYFFHIKNYIFTSGGTVTNGYYIGLIVQSTCVGGSILYQALLCGVWMLSPVPAFSPGTSVSSRTPKNMHSRLIGHSKIVPGCDCEHEWFVVYVCAVIGWKQVQGVPHLLPEDG